MKTTLHHTMRKAAFLLAVLTLLTVSATLWTGAAENNADAPRVCDNAGLLTADQISQLNVRIYDLKRLYDTDFVIVTVNSLGGKSVTAYAGEFYDKYSYGHNASRDGVLMLVAIDSRNYYFLTHGTAVGKIPNNGGITALGDKVIPHLAVGDYYAAFETYLDTAASMIAAPSPNEGQVVSSGRTDEFVHIGFDDIPSAADRWERIGFFAVMGIVAGFITTYVMKRGMKTARAQKFAMDYVRPGSFTLTRKQDIFLYRTRTRVRVQSNNSSRGGGRSGGSRGGGGGKF